MKKIYLKIWQLAKPYYKQGRLMDLEHIEWMMEKAMMVCQKENIDDSILMPLVILHDIGYYQLANKNGDPFNQDLKRAHMKTGASMAEEILDKVNYSPDKIKEIIYYISVHDNWLFKDFRPFLDNKILNILTDLDFTWTATSCGFIFAKQATGKTYKEMLDFLIFRKTPLDNTPFSTKTTQAIYEGYFEERKKELEGKN